MIARRGRQCGVDAWPHRFRHHFSHTWLDRGGAEGDLMELNGWSSPQMLRRYGASARSARARRTYDRIMTGRPYRSSHHRVRSTLIAPGSWLAAQLPGITLNRVISARSALARRRRTSESAEMSTSPTRISMQQLAYALTLYRR